jgi:hypothetical protein
MIDLLRKAQSIILVNDIVMWNHDAYTLYRVGFVDQYSIRISHVYTYQGEGRPHKEIEFISPDLVYSLDNFSKYEGLLIYD